MFCSQGDVQRGEVLINKGRMIVQQNQGKGQMGQNPMGKGVLQQGPGGQGAGIVCGLRGSGGLATFIPLAKTVRQVAITPTTASHP